MSNFDDLVAGATDKLRGEARDAQRREAEMVHFRWLFDTTLASTGQGAVRTLVANRVSPEVSGYLKESFLSERPKVTRPGQGWRFPNGLWLKADGTWWNGGMVNRNAGRNSRVGRAPLLIWTPGQQLTSKILFGRQQVEGTFITSDDNPPHFFVEGETVRIGHVVQYSVPFGYWVAQHVARRMAD